ncbi:MAG: hypothetical protein FJ115_16520 [Deltaproteobacteria bacterium]|nr:hypothetical protein [Deltaproteobacteria bacterium]MBM4325160.1 hypothetical protein [Deltaproteobacteria bacterium]MBM4346738.1 hypothetical protein [Deltaproteobacteria bacterium]
MIKKDRVVTFAKSGHSIMKLFIITYALMICLVACDSKPSSSQGKSEVLPVPKVTIEKERIQKEESLPPEVKIRLKRDGKDNYSWELSGSDVNEILKINEKLKKQLGGEQHK